MPILCSVGVGGGVNVRWVCVNVSEIEMERDWDVERRDRDGERYGWRETGMGER